MSIDVSIVMTHYRRTDLLERSFVSIASQMPKAQYEIVVVNDDQPNKRLIHLCQRFVEFGIRVRILNTFRSAPFRNQSYAMNCGVKSANGYVIILQSAEVMHTGPVIDGMNQLVGDSPNAYYCARCVSLLPQDASWITENIGDIANNNKILKAFDYPTRGEYVGPTNPKYYFFLAGIKRSTYLQIGGMDEDFDRPGYDDNFFEFSTKMNGLDCRILTEVEWFGLHQHHDRPLEDPGYGRSLMQMKSLFEQKQACILHNGGSPIANQGREWGVLPADAEVILG